MTGTDDYHSSSASSCGFKEAHWDSEVRELSQLLKVGHIPADSYEHIISSVQAFC